MMAFQVRPRPGSYTREKPARNERYLMFIRRHGCCACGSTRNVEAAHTGPHGLGQKSADAATIPLCFHCHRGDVDSLHNVGPEQFARDHALNVPQLIAGYQAAFIAFQIRREGAK
jgi:hypothetical protein